MDFLKKGELSEEELKKVVGGAAFSGRGYKVTWKCKFCNNELVTENSLEHGLCQSCGKDGYVSVNTEWTE